ncbi:MAG: condensation domain-containing protein, partial [Pseudomonadales bacterium]
MLYNNMHHIITDAWSTDLLKRDLMVFYHALVSGSAPELPVLEIQYKDFAHWQAHKLKEGALDTHRDFWLAQLDGELGRIDLPSSKTRPHLKTFDGFRIVKHLRSSLKKQLGTFCQKEGGSNFMGLLAAWKVLLYRYTGQTVLLIGSPIAGRDHADLT